MLFSSIPFLFYFLPIVLILYFASPWKLKNFVLLASSLVFYGWGEPKYVFLMLASIIMFFVCGLLVEKAKTKQWKKVWLAVSVIASVALLGIFKYADFFIDNFNKMTGLNVGLLKLALPIGISFYTFQCLSYVIDVYRGTVEAQKNPINFGAYVALFPQLIAGPIVRYVDVARELNHRTHSFDGFTLGMRRFIIGLAKKIIIANQLGELTNIFRTCGEKSVLFYWIYAIAFALHIYFDFSGYSDMAIGLGKIFGFNFIENFNYPYMSKSIGEFWRRWHMSLGSWFRDYIYIPLGGNRVSRGRWVFNTLVVWMLTGLWHGAAWNFVVWGLLYALFLMVEKFILKDKKMPQIFSRAYTLLMVVLGFVLFNAVDFTQAWSDITGMFFMNGVPIVNDVTMYYLASYSILLIVGVIGATPLIKNIAVKLSTKPKTRVVTAIIEPVVLFGLLAICVAYLVDGSFNPFLYFRF